MNINHPNFHGDNYQFADNIYNDYRLTLSGLDLWKLVPKEKFSATDRRFLDRQLEIISRPNAPMPEKFDAITKVIEHLSRQSEVTVPQEAYESFFRDRDDNPVRFDAFLSFAQEDVETATALYQALTQLGLKIWFSRVHLHYGDSIMGVISNAIRLSDGGILLLSEHTFSDPRHFPIQELNTLFNQHIYRDLFFYPVYHDISHDYILDHAPELADQYAADTRRGVDTVANDFRAALNRHRRF